jgi:hypothetical protein
MFKIKTAMLTSLLIPVTAYSMSMEAYLLKASDRTQTVAFNEKVFNANNHGSNWSSSWIDDAEFRIQHEEDEKNNSSETYSLRMRPKYGSAREAENTIYAVTTQQSLLQENKILSTDLRQRYLNIIEVLSLQLEIKHLREKQELLQLEIKTERTLARSHDFNAEKLQRLVLDFEHTSTQIELFHQRKTVVTTDLQLSVGVNREVFLLNMMPPGIMKDTIDKYKIELKNINAIPDVRMAKLGKTLAASRLKLQQAEQNIGVDLLEFKYEDKDNSAFGITLGIRLPGGKNAKSIERYSDNSKANEKYQLVMDSASSTVRKKTSEINLDYRAWRINQIALQKIKKLSTEPARTRNPALITGLRRQLLSLNKSGDEIRIRLLRNYIDLLHISGLLSQYPLKNWLFSGLPTLSENQQRK